MKDLELFSTNELSNEGVKIDLTDVEGNPTKHWLKILSTDSKAFKKAQAVFKKKIFDIRERSNSVDMFDDSEEGDKAALELLASLVVAWSFKEDDGSDYPCTKPNIVKLLTDAPMLASEIDTASARRKNFIKRSSKQSANTQSKNLSSKKPQTIPASAS